MVISSVYSSLIGMLYKGVSAVSSVSVYISHVLFYGNCWSILASKEPKPAGNLNIQSTNHATFFSFYVQIEVILINYLSS